MSLKARVVVRMSDELEQWIGQQADSEGLDSATWVRSTLTKIKNGLAAKSVAPMEQTFVQQEAQFVEQSEEPVDPDDLVNEALAQAAGQQEMEVAHEQAQSNGVRPVFRRPTPYSLANQPGWIK